MRDDARELTRTWTTSSSSTPWARWFLLRGMRDPHLHAAHLEEFTFSLLGLLSPCKLSLNGKNKAVRILAKAVTLPRQFYENGTLQSAPYDIFATIRTVR
jgi:hypothetical protein